MAPVNVVVLACGWNGSCNDSNLLNCCTVLRLLASLRLAPKPSKLSRLIVLIQHANSETLWCTQNTETSLPATLYYTIEDQIVRLKLN